MIILQDTREQNPWDFSFYGFTQQRQTLKTGDYTLVGYEDILCIERKRTTGEIAINIGSKSKPFYAELTRMGSYKYRFLILEFSEQDVSEFPKGSGIPYKTQAKLRISANFILSSITKISNEYGVNVIFAGSRENAISEVINIFNEIQSGQIDKPIF